MATQKCSIWGHLYKYWLPIHKVIFFSVLLSFFKKYKWRKTDRVFFVFFLPTNRSATKNNHCLDEPLWSIYSDIHLERLPWFALPNESVPLSSMYFLKFFIQSRTQVTYSAFGTWCLNTRPENRKPNASPRASKWKRHYFNLGSCYGQAPENQSRCGLVTIIASILVWRNDLQTD